MSENPYCMRCGKHLGMPNHETNEHDEAAARQKPAGHDTTEAGR